MCFNSEFRYPPDVLELAREIAQAEADIKLWNSKFEKLIREKLILEKKLDLCQNQTEDKNKLQFIEDNLCQKMGKLSNCSKDTRGKIQEKETQIFDQELLLKDLHKRILDYRQRLIKLEVFESQNYSIAENYR